jgi:hypothetical protein
MKSFLLSSLLTTLVLPTLTTAGPMALFNGSDLRGWVQRGGAATYTIEGDEIVGTSRLNTPNSFLCTEKTYGDFILEYDFKVDPSLNSGVQIRSECFDTETQIEWKGQTIQIPAGRVHGYQVEIDPNPKQNRWWSAGLYDEARRKWLYPGANGGDPKAFTEQGRKLFKQGDWNHVRVEAIGDSIRTWLNGAPCADIQDSMTPRGFIALQVHSIQQDTSKEGTQVRWRHLSIVDLSAAKPAMTNNALSPEETAAGWQLLWDGRTTTGWRSAKGEDFPAKGWQIQDGVLSVLASKGQESGAGGDIITRQRFSQFELSVDFRLTPGANSGIKYFVQPGLDPITGTGAKATVGSAIGLEYQILDDALHPDAKLGRNGNRTLASLYDLMPADAGKQPNPIGAWNTARLLVTENRVEHWLNGRKVLTYDRKSPAFHEAVALSKYKSIPGFGTWPDGHILLQEHGDNVSFRNVKIRNLSAH